MIQRDLESLLMERTIRKYLNLIKSRFRKENVKFINHITFSRLERREINNRKFVSDNESNLSGIVIYYSNFQRRFTIW